MRKLIGLILTLVFLMAVPYGAAIASDEVGMELSATTPTSQEEVIGSFIFEGYWDVWGAKGNWQNGYGPGSKNLSCDSDPVYVSGFQIGDRGLKDLLRRYELTRAEVKAVYPLTKEEYDNAGKRWGEDWETYEEGRYRMMPNNPSAAIKSFDKSTGQTVVQWMLDYPQKVNPVDPESVPYGPLGRAFNTKAHLDQIDHRFISPAELQALMKNPNAEGWRVYFPAIVYWYGIPKPEMNLTATAITAGVSKPHPNQKCNGTVTFKNNSTMALSNVAVGFFNGKFHGYLKDAAGNLITRADFAPGEEKTFNFVWTSPGSGTATLKGVIDTPPLPDDYAETDESDNIVEIQLSVTAPPPASVGKGTLTLSAVSQSRSIKRPAGTAKWTDWVTATFVAPPAPKLSPCYKLKEWRIESVTITYPKKHKWFTFGSPWPPQGTKTIPMKIVGDTKAVVEFQEDWSLNGADVYARYVDEDYEEIVDEGHVPGPTYYPITVNYKMRWEYEKGHLECCGTLECNPCCKNYRKYVKHPTESVTAQLLVNGTGVNSVAG